MELNRLLQLSLGVACSALFGPWFVISLGPIPSGNLKVIAILFTAGLVVAWMFLQIAAIMRHGWRGLALLVGLPFVLWWPTFYVLISLAPG
jgi:hypothetical protein